MIILLDVIYVIIIIEAVFYLPFLLSCIFKKSCKWKGCPFRCREQGETQMRICTKCPFPFDDAEEKELNDTLDRIEKLIDTLAQENKEGTD